MLAFLCAAILALPRLAQAATTLTSPDLITLLPPSPEKVSIDGGLDWPKLSTLVAGASSYDWWYFDAVSSQTNASITVVFFNSGLLGFNVFNLVAPYSLQVSGTFDDGTPFAQLIVPAPGGMSFTKNDDGGIFGSWAGIGATFSGTPLTADKVQYNVSLNLPTYGIVGNMILNSRAPPHYPCGPNVAGQNEAVSKYVYWSNAVPDAQAIVDMTVYGQHIAFSDGVGYHDKNWGVTNFFLSIQTWYWGHAYFAPYSVVWFDAVDVNGLETFSGYVVKDGKVIGSGCGTNFVTARPWGTNSVYPPNLLSGGLPQGLQITFNLTQGLFVVNATTGPKAIDIAVYQRALTSVTGGFVNGPQSSGRGQFEQFTF